MSSSWDTNPIRSDFFAIGEGRVPGYADVFKYGFQVAIPTTEEPVWDQGGAYTYQSVAAVAKVSSSSADDASGGTGARTVEIFGLDANYALLSEIVTLNGQTAVNTVGLYIRIFRGTVRTAGSTGMNLGDIYAGDGTVTSGVPATKYLKVSVGEGQTLMAIYTIPEGFSGRMVRLGASSFGNSNTFTTVRLRVREFGGVFVARDKFIVTRALVSLPHKAPTLFPAKSDIQVTGEASSGTTDLSAFFEVILSAN